MNEVVRKEALEERTVLALAAAGAVALLAVAALSFMPVGDAWVGLSWWIGQHNSTAGLILGIYGEIHAAFHGWMFAFVVGSGWGAVIGAVYGL